jgi:hypothetical protein
LAKKYCIWVVSPPGYIHSQAFDYLALSLNCAFRELGYQAPIVRDIANITDYPVIIGSNLLPSLGNIHIPDTSIIYNLEQILLGSPWINEKYLNFLRSYDVWDYSRRNIDELKKLGITNVKYCGIGYVPELTQMRPSNNEDIDILWYGSLNERRIYILEKLQDMDLNVCSLFGVYGDERDQYIARSKIVLNIHFYESKVLEIGRIYYLLANKRFVVSEKGNDEELEGPLREGLVFAPYDNIISACLSYLKEDHLRAEIAERGFALIKGLRQVEFLKDVLNS